MWWLVFVSACAAVTITASDTTTTFTKREETAVFELQNIVRKIYVYKAGTNTNAATIHLTDTQNLISTVLQTKTQDVIHLKGNNEHGVVYEDHYLTTTVNVEYTEHVTTVLDVTRTEFQTTTIQVPVEIVLIITSTDFDIQRENGTLEITSTETIFETANLPLTTELAETVFETENETHTLYSFLVPSANP